MTQSITAYISKIYEWLESNRIVDYISKHLTFQHNFNEANQ